MLSVICPIYNEEKYIGQCVESILAQDYPKDDLEILFVDGMSTDDTRCIVVNYSNEYPFIKLFDNPKRNTEFPTPNLLLKTSRIANVFGVLFNTSVLQTTPTLSASNSTIRPINAEK